MKLPADEIESLLGLAFEDTLEFKAYQRILRLDVIPSEYEVVFNSLYAMLDESNELNSIELVHRCNNLISGDDIGRYISKYNKKADYRSYVDKIKLYYAHNIISDATKVFLKKPTKDELDGLLAKVIGLHNDTLESVSPKTLLEKLIENKLKGFIGIPSGFEHIDYATKGLQGGLLGIGTFSEMGKTTFAKVLTSNLLLQGYKVGWLSFETTHDNILKGMYQVMTGFDSDNLLNDDYTDFREPVIKAKDICESQLHVLGSESFGKRYRLEELEELVRSLIRKGCKTIFIDTLESIPIKHFGKTFEGINIVEAALQKLGTKYNVTIITIVQVKKGVSKLKMPTSEDLKYVDKSNYDGIIVFYVPEIAETEDNKRHIMTSKKDSYITIFSFLKNRWGLELSNVEFQMEYFTNHQNYRQKGQYGEYIDFEFVDKYYPHMLENTYSIDKLNLSGVRTDEIDW